MIKNFHQVSDNVFRGSAPSPKDVCFLNKQLKINKIISLDEDSGKKIDRVCKLLGIDHIIIPISVHDKSTIHYLLNYDIPSLFNKSDNVYTHCYRGKDRTGLLIALYRCLCENWNSQDAILEAKELGFGTGIRLDSENFYINLIKSLAKDNQDVNNANIVDNVNELDGQYRDYTLDRYEQQSWSPFADYSVKEYPASSVDKYDYDEQYRNRENYNEPEDIYDIYLRRTTMPQVGVYDQNTQGINGAGPSLIGSGYV